MKVSTAPCVLGEAGVELPTVKLPPDKVSTVAPLPEPPKLKYFTDASMVVTPKAPVLSATE